MQNQHRCFWGDVEHQVDKNWCRHVTRCQICGRRKEVKYSSGVKVLETLSAPDPKFSPRLTTGERLKNLKKVSK